MSALGLARRIANVVLRPLGLELERLESEHNWSDGRTFIPFHTTLAAAAVAGLSVSDFVEDKYNRHGVTEEAIHHMVDLGVFNGEITTVCEIGPGTGRYLERTIRLCHPSRYEIYETAADWAEWLVRTHGVTYMPTDGRTLEGTPSRSMDLVQAHKVFVTTPTLTTCSYLDEMARVVREGGKVVFDILSEDCIDQPTLERWLESGTFRAYPFVMPKQYVIDFLARRGLKFQASFFEEMRPGKTECMVFIRGPADDGRSA
jgi:hypothetical protein